MTRSESFLVDRTRPLERLDTFLKSRFPAHSRGALQRLIEEGHIRVDGRRVKPTHHPRAGEEVTIQFPEPRVATAHPEAIPLDILFEDNFMIVLNKPPGIVVHPAAGNEEHTLVNALLHHCGIRLSGIGGVARPGIVHRLDKDTSGCLVVAKTDAAHTSLAEQFATREVEKTYHALVCGAPRVPTGDIRLSIGRHPTQRKKMAAGAGRGREAWTSYRLLESFGVAALMEAMIHTGRTHQIRVHFEHLGCPVVGDLVYGSRPNKRLVEQTACKAPRQMLHACRLSFTHPITRKAQTFSAPWPGDFSTMVQALRKT